MLISHFLAYLHLAIFPFLFTYLFFASLLTQGIDIGGMMGNSSMMMQSVMKAKITTDAYYIGFIPGVLATAIGTALAGIGIFKRKTASLFKELQA